MVILIFIFSCVPADSVASVTQQSWDHETMSWVQL